MKFKVSFLCLALVVLFVSSGSTLNVIAEETINKFSDELFNAYNTISANEQLDVLVWLDNDATENYQALSATLASPELEVQSSSRSADSADLTSCALAQNTKEANLARIQEHIMQKRELARAVYLAENSKQAATLEAKLDSGEILYISQYSPLLVCRLKRSEALKFAASSSVKKLSYSPTKKVETMSNAIATMGINDLQDSEFSAAGIKIGMVEADGTPNLEDAVFSDYTNKVSIIGDANNDEHASSVAMIILQMVPDLTRLYCSYSDTTSDVVEVTETLLSQGVSVINYSMGIFPLANNNGHLTAYNEYSEWFDHIAYNHSVHCVVGAGNVDEYGTHAVSSIAMAHNVIAVGNVDDRNTPSTADDQLSSTSSYNGEILSDLPLRPDLCAPGDNTFISSPSMTSFGGTSSATPKVTAVVAALCAYEPTLLTKQALMKTIIMSSVSVETPRKYDTTPKAYGDVSSNYKMYGTGIINAYNAIQLIDSGTYTSGSITASESEDVYYIGNIPAGQTVTITLSFLKRSRFTSQDNHELEGSNLVTSNLADLDLYVCAAPLYIANSCSKTSNHVKSITTNNNSETIIFTAATTDDYVICIDKAAGQGSYEIIYGVSWFIEDSDSN